MKILATLAIAAALSAALLPGGANAQGKIYKWCLEEGRSTNGGGQTLCRFDSYAQCMQSRNGGGDRCVQNFYNQRP